MESEPFSAESREEFAASVPDDVKKYVVKLKSRAFLPRKDLSVDFPHIRGDGEDTKRIYVQFENIPSRWQRRELTELGVVLEGYLADNTYYARVMERAFEDLRRLSYVRGFANISYVDKLSEGLYTGRVRDSAKNPDGSLSLKVTFDESTPLEEAKKVIESLGGKVVSESYLFGNRLAVKLNLDRVRLLAEREAVRRVDEAPPRIVTYNSTASNRSEADLARLHPNADPEKDFETTTGLGVNVGIWDGGAVEAGHSEFQLSTGSRVTVVDNVAATRHATHVAGTMGAAGIGNFRAKGMAPGMSIFSWDISGDVPTEMRNGVANQNIVISNNSWGFGLSGQDPLFGDYTADSRDMDQVVKDTGLIMVFAAGDDRDEGDGFLRASGDEDANYYDLLAPRQVAKNVITVGAVHGAPLQGSGHPRSVPPAYVSPDAESGPYESVTRIVPDPGSASSTITAPESEGVNETNFSITINVWAGGGKPPADLRRLRLTSPAGPVQRTWELVNLQRVGGALVLSGTLMNDRFGTTAPNAVGLVSGAGDGPVNTLGTWTLEATDGVFGGINNDPEGTLIAFNWSITTVRKSRAPFSSAGPPDDGRIKPDVVADGWQLVSSDINNQYIRLSGTSMAAPTVAGGIALLTESYRREQGGEDPSPEVIKALLIQTAHDIAIDRDTQFLRQPLGPDYQTGYGEVDIDAALEVIEDDAVNSIALTLRPPNLVGPLGFANVTGLAFDPATSTLYGVDINSDQLITIDSTTGAGTAVGALGFNMVNSLAFDSATSTLYGVDVVTDQLITINTTTGVGSVLGAGPLGFDDVAGLAFNAGKLYGVDITTDQLITIDTTTGVGTAIGAGPGSLGFASVSGLSFDASGTLYGADADTDQLITINTANGTGTIGGALGFNDVSGLSFEPSAAALFGSDNDSNQLIVIDPVQRQEAAPNGATPTIITGTIENGEIQEYNMYVNGTQGPIKVTLAWTDEPGDPNAARAIVNNLDLELVEPDGLTVHFPFRLTASDPSGWLRAGTYAHAYIASIITNPTDAQRTLESNGVDNVEQVMYPRPGAIGPTNMPGESLDFTNVFDTPPGPDPDPTDPSFPTGRWTIRIRGSSVPTLTQNLALVSNYPAMPDQSVFTKEEFLEIPDNDAAGVSSIASFPVTDVNPVDGVADEAVIINNDLTVFINVSHPAPSELTATLTHPEGTTTVDLSAFVVNGLATINAGDPALDPFDGLSTHFGLNGGWTLTLVDGAARNEGTLESWGLKVGSATLLANKANVIPDDTFDGIESLLSVLADTDSAAGVQDIGITELDIDVDIVHGLTQDLIITLISPAGTEVVLHNQTPDFGDPGYDRTTYDRLTIPAESLKAFNGEGVLGKWRLRVQDVGADGSHPGIRQYVRQWRLQVQGSTRYAPVITPVVPKADKTFVIPEDTQFTYSLTPHESDVEDSGSRLNWSIKGVDTSLFTASIDSQDLLTVTPALNLFGASQPLPATVPVEPLAAFEGDTMIGTWRLRIIDNDPGNALGAVPGQLDDWQLVLDDGTTFSAASFATISLPRGIPDNEPVGGLFSDIVIPNVPANDILVQNTNDLNVLVNISHGDVTDLLVTLEHTDTGTQIKLHDQTINFTPDNPATQPQDESRIDINTTYSDDVVTLTLTDSHGLTATQTVVVNIQSVNDAPVLQGLPDQTLTEDIPKDDAFNLWDYASDVETLPSQLTYSIVPPLPDSRVGVSLDEKATGVFVDFNPAPDFFSTTAIPVTIKVEDPDGASDTDAFDVIINPVNDPPQINPAVADFSYLEDEPNIVNRTLDLNGNEVDVDNTDSELKWSVEGVDTSLHTTNDPDASADLLIFTPLLNQNGVDEITLVLKDKDGLEDRETITVTVIPVNDPPQFDFNLPDITVAKNSVTLNAFPHTLDYYVSDVDHADSELTYSIVANTEPRVGVSINGARNIDVRPVADFAGFSDVVIEARDPGGETATDIIRVTVTDGAAGPQFRVLPNITLAEDRLCDDAFNLKDFVSGVGPAPTFTIVDQAIIEPGNLADVPDCGVAIDSNDNIDVNPSPDAYGACRVTVKVTDGGLSDDAAFDVTIVGVNDPPEINPLPTDIITDEDTPFTAVLTNFETDPEDSGGGLDWQVAGDNPSLFNAWVENIDADELVFAPAPDAFGQGFASLTLRDHGPAALISGQIDFTNPLTIKDSVNDPLNGKDLFTIDLNDGNGQQTVDLAPDRAQFRTGVLTFPLVFTPGVSDRFVLDVPGEGTGLVVDLAGGRSKAIPGPLGFTNVSGVAFDGTSTLHGVDIDADRLITIDTTTGVGAAIGIIGFSDVNCLAFVGTTLYGADTTAGRLITINTGTGAGSAVGAAQIGFDDVAGLAFDAATSTLYGVDRDTDQLITINAATGVGAAVGALGFDAVSGLSFDPSGNLFGADTASGQLIKINKATGAGAVVGVLGYGDVSGLAFNSSGTLFGVDSATDRLIIVDPAENAVYNDVSQLINGAGALAVGLAAAARNALAAASGAPGEITVSDGGNNTVLFTRATAGPGRSIVFHEDNGALRLLKIPQFLANSATAGDVNLPDISAAAAKCEAAVNLAITNPDEVVVLPDKSSNALLFIRKTTGPAVIKGDQLAFPLTISDGVNDEFYLDLNDGFGPRPVDIAGGSFDAIGDLASEVESAVDDVLTAAGIDPREVLVSAGSDDNLILGRASAGPAVYRSGPLSFPMTIADGANDVFFIDLSRDGDGPILVDIEGQTFSRLEDLVIALEGAVDQALTAALLDPDEVTVAPEGSAIAFKRASAGLGANITITPGANDALDVLNIITGTAGTNDIELTAGANNALPSLGLSSVARANDLVILNAPANSVLTSLNITPGTAPGGLTDASQITVTVNPINDPPSIDPEIPDPLDDPARPRTLIVYENTPRTYDLTKHENDPEDSGADLVWSVSGGDPNLFTAVIDVLSDDLTITPKMVLADESDVITLTLTDSNNATDTQDVTVVVAEAPPTVTLSAAPNPPDEGATVTFTAAPVSTVGYGFTRYDWAFGDGAIDTTTIPTTTHAYADDTGGPFNATVTVTDDSGSVGLDALQVAVVNVAPTADAGGPYSGDEGSAVVFSGSAGDPGADTLTYEWDFDYDGATFTADASGVGLTSPSHTYPDDGQFTVALRVSDGDGGVSQIAAAAVTIANVAPTANAGGPYTGDEASAIAFSGSASDPGADSLIYDWDFDYDGRFIADISGVNLTTPSHAYPDDGQYTVALRVRDDDGGVSQISTASVAVDNVAPTSDAGGPYTGDEGSGIAFSGSATDPGADTLTYEWDFDYDGAFTTDVSGVDLTSPSHTYPDDGQYNVALRVSDEDGGVSAISTASVTVANAAPIAFGGGPYTGDEGSAVTFAGSASDAAGDTLTYEWAFDYDGLTFTADVRGVDLASPSHTYSDNRTYTVGLRVSDDDGGVSKIAITLATVANVPPTADAGGPYSGDEGSAISFAGSATDPGTDTLTYEWDFDYDGEFTADVNGVDLTSPSHAYEDDRQYTVALRVTDDDGGVSPIATAFVTISNLPPTANAGGPYTGDEGSGIAFAGAADDPGEDVLTYEWDFDYNGVTFTLDASGVNLASPSHAYPDDGQYTAALRVRDDDGDVSQTSTTLVTIANAAPTAHAGGPYAGDEGSAIKFAGSANDPGADALTYQWDFDYNGVTFTLDAVGINLTSPSHTYADDGKYTVALRALDDDGALSQISTAAVTINNVAPTADPGGPYTGSEGSAVTFEGSATDPGADTLTYQWDFDYNGVAFSVDVSGVNLTSPSYTYTDDGQYTVALRVRDDEGDASQISTTTVTIGNAAPTADAGGPYTGDEGSPIAFAGSANDPGADTLTYQWDFDYNGVTFISDVSGVDLASPSHAYANDGQYTAALRALDDDGGMSQISTAPVAVGNVDPTANAGGPYTGDEGASIAFAGSAADPGADTLTYEWDFDYNGVAFTVGASGKDMTSPSYTYADDGQYTVALRVRDDDDMSPISTADVTIANVTPTADAGGPYTADEGSPISFAGAADDPGDDVATYEWDFDYDGAAFDVEATGANPSHVYPDNAAYTAALRVTDDDGAVSPIAIAPVTIANVAPIANAAGPYIGDEGSAMTFAGAAIDPSPIDALTYQWDLDYDVVTFNVDVSGVNLTNPTKTSPDDTTYTIGLRVRDDDGGVSEISAAQVTVVNVAPTADAGGPYIADEGSILTFTASVVDPGADAHTYEWDLSYDGVVFNTERRGPNLTSVQKQAGDDIAYTIAVRVTDDDEGVSGISTAEVTVNNLPPQVDAGGPYSGDEGSPIPFSGQAADIATDDLTYQWDFDYNGVDFTADASGAGLTSPSYSYSEDGAYTVALKVTDDDGGVGMDTAQVTVNNLTPIADAGPDQSVEEQTVVTLDGSASMDPGGGQLDFFWRQTAGAPVTLSDEAAVNPTFTAPSVNVSPMEVLTFELTVTDGKGASDTIATNVNVAAVFEPALLVSSFKMTLDANPLHDKLQIAGILNAAPNDFDFFAEPLTIELSDGVNPPFDFSTRLQQVGAKGGKFGFKSQTAKIRLRLSNKGSSGGTFKILLVSSLGQNVDPSRLITVRLRNANFDESATIRPMVGANGKASFKIGKNGLEAPLLFVVKAALKVDPNRPNNDRFSVKGYFPNTGKDAPTQFQSFTFAIAGFVDEDIPLAGKDGRYSFKGKRAGVTLAKIDPIAGAFVIKGSRADLQSARINPVEIRLGVVNFQGIATVNMSQKAKGAGYR